LPETVADLLTDFDECFLRRWEIQQRCSYWG